MSLADQLAHISQEAHDVALDRNRRSELHSISFLYDPHYAATQDYESIFAESLEALQKLQTLDKRFSRFRDTIFSDLSVSIDRLTQTKEQNKNIDKTINVFLSLLAPYWHLAISVKAAEWPLRRFSMNVYNSEFLLLTALPYFDQPIFERILYVIPKLPMIFQWLSGFKKAQRCPARTTITRSFSDIDFFNLYSKFINQEVAHHNQYRKQLVFFVVMTVSGLASLASSNSDHLADFISLSLESTSTLMVSKDQESCVSAFTILSAVSSAVPLSREVIMASIDTIILSFDGDLSIASFRCILKLYQNIQSDSLAPLRSSTVNGLPKELLSPGSDYLHLIRFTRYSNKFVTSYLRALIIAGKSIESSVFDSLRFDFHFTKKQLQLLETDIITHVRDSSSGGQEFVSFLKFLIDQDKQQFLSVLNQSKMSVENLEMLVQSTLLLVEDIEDLSQQDSGDSVTVSIDDETESDVDLLSLFEDHKTDVATFLSSDSVINTSFHDLQSIYLRSIQVQSEGLFLDTSFKDVDQRISFLLRVASGSQIPIRGRINSLGQLKKLIEGLDPTVFVYSILPVLCTLFLDPNPKMRSQAVDVLEVIHSRPKSNAKRILLEHMYGSANVAMISPKDGSIFISKLLINKQLFKLDAESLLQSFHSIIGSKKLAQMVLAFFASHTTIVDVPDIKAKLLKITSAGCLSLKGASSPSELFSDLLSSYLKERSQWKEKCEVTSSDFDVFELQIIELVREKENNLSALTLLEEALVSPFEHLASVSQHRLVQIFPTLKFEHQIRIISYLLEDGLKDDSAVKYDPLELLENLQLSDAIFVQLLKGSVVGTSSSQPQNNVPKRRRRSSASARQAMKETEVSSLANLHLRKVTILLDLLFFFSSKQTFKPSLDLLKFLFTILDDLETLSMDGKLPVLYSQETLASCMLNVINTMKESQLSIDNTSAIRADIIVSSIRSSDSPQVQNKLLLVIAALASLSPELVLHSVMPIFTFMGAHTIRQDDEFSTHVVEETILCVVPALASTAKSGMAEEVDFLLTSFVGAFPHIPRHRRVRLFTTLARTLSSQLSVYLILFLCGQQYANAYAKHKMANCSALTDFSSIFLQSFTPEEQLDAARRYLALWKDLPEDVVEKGSKTFGELTSRVIFGPSIVAMNKSELYNLRKGLLSYLRHSLVDFKSTSDIPKLRLKITSEFLQNGSSEENLSVFSGLIKDVLGLADEYSNSFEDEEILKKFYKLLGDILSLLPIQYFVKSISSILIAPSASMRTKQHVANLASAKFELEHIDNTYAQEGISILTPILLDAIISCENVELSQACFDTLASFFQRFHDRLESELLLRSLDVAVGESGLLSKSGPELTIAAINCVTSVVTVAGVKIIGYFPKIISSLYKIFETTTDAADGSDEEESARLIQISILVLFSAMMRKIPNFLTPNVQDFTDITFRAKLVPDSIRNTVLATMVNSVDSKTVLSALCKLWSKVSDLDAATIGLFLSTLDLEVDKLDKKTAITESSMFTRFFLNALEFQGTSKFDINTVNRIESSISKCGIQYVLKLNDKNFRPLFASIVRWAFDGEGVVTSINEIERLQSFFKFFNKLQEQLRSIITTYFSYLLDSTESLLDRFSKGSIDNILLKRLVFISLTSSFKYDQSEYWQTSTRFTPISKCLCDQLTNVEDTIGKHLVKALTALVQTASSEEHNKQVNDLLMSHMKAECKPKEKFWTVRTLKNIYKKMGENWLSLLPQLVPLIAELLEDDDEEVEMEVRTGLAKVIEDVMGEPLDRYLQ
ncbi:hypothetical protein FOA43_000725 [Brettanomyces nanus]|uniref:U3 small nucleolar RNA-associated protein 10 n=1 Tax=Eeniella nana TaxID=13502 RepID=A0A875RZF7_EENNA|nr:uncharacterized protein FOA43_000725 [Brettanomyces nanus]QPG73415.1 hypothetical protein FOA43_000725 [Brettanomyces nanus]